MLDLASLEQRRAHRSLDRTCLLRQFHLDPHPNLAAYLLRLALRPRLGLALLLNSYPHSSLHLGQTRPFYLRLIPSLRPYLCSSRLSVFCLSHPASFAWTCLQLCLSFCRLLIFSSPYLFWFS